MTILRALAGAAVVALAAWCIGRLLIRSRQVPHAIVSAAGGAVLSLVLFALFAAGVAKTPVLIGLGLLGCVPVLWLRPRFQFAAPTWAWICGALYGVVYLLYALTPEVQSDALHYHLWLAAESQTSGGFPTAISFYNILPQGMETLFAMAYAIGGEPAAKLLHLGCLFGCVALMPAIATRLSLDETAGWLAGLLFAMAPVVGISSTCAYTDAALVFFTLAALLAAESADAIPAGLCAGFCYAIKFTGAFTAVLGLSILLLRRQYRAALLFTAGVVLVAAPWIARAFLLTGNPFAPLASSLFPNPYFHLETMQNLSAYLRHYGGLSWRDVPLQITLRGDVLQGLIGPVFLALPVALLALRQRAGRIALALAAGLAIPWAFNIGTRFLMPALPFLALAMVMAIPRPLGFLLLVVHAVTSWPHAVRLYAPTGTWTLDPEIPFAASATYQTEKSVEAAMAAFLRNNTAPTDRILDLINAPAALTRRQLVNVWQSASGDRITHALELARTPGLGQFYEWRIPLNGRPLEGLRVEFTAAQPAGTAIREMQLIGEDGQFVKPTIVWSVEAQPNPWESALALDRNRASGWATWMPVVPGMYWRVDFNAPLKLREIRCIADNTALQAKPQFSDTAGQALPAEKPTPAPVLNLREAAMRYARREGITHVVAQRDESNDALSRIGQALEEDPRDWGLERVARYDNISLYRIR